MQNLSIEPFAAAIVLIGIGVMIRAIRLQAAVLLIIIAGAAFALTSSFGAYAQYVPSWVFWIVVIVLGINLLSAIFRVLFGRGAAEGFTGNLLFGIFTPILNLLGGLLRTIFRVR